MCCITHSRVRQDDDNIRTWQYVEEGIERGKPDLIVLTGDNIYGETDDSGQMWLEGIEKMDSYEIPWAIVWGNHDVESQKGVRWQISQVRYSKYGIVKQNNTDAVTHQGGNSNYTIGIKQGGEITYVFYMLDTNGAKVKNGESVLANNPDITYINQTDGLHTTQIEWIENSYQALSATLGEVPTMWFMHIPPQEAFRAWQIRYAPQRPNNVSRGTPLTANKGNDMGKAYENMCYFKTDLQLLPLMKQTNCTNVFFGHDHVNATSVEWEGIRFTYGLKTGTYDYFDYEGQLLGTLLIEIGQGAPKVTYQYSELELTDVPGPGK